MMESVNVLRIKFANPAQTGPTQEPCRLSLSGSVVGGNLISLVIALILSHSNLGGVTDKC